VFLGSAGTLIYLSAIEYYSRLKLVLFEPQAVAEYLLRPPYLFVVPCVLAGSTFGLLCLLQAPT